MRHFRLFITYMLLLGLFSRAQASIIYVNKSATGANNGSTWADAFQELSAALPTAQYGDAVWVASGHYMPFIYGVTNTFTMISGVKLLGGFAGGEITETQRDPSANETILSCKFEFNQTPEFFPGYNVIYCAGTDSSTLVDGFRIFNMQAGPFNGEDCDKDQHKCYGGGIFLYSPSPDTSTFLTIANCRFIESNCCDAGGGAIGVNFSEGSGGFIIKHCEFKGNHAILGGAFHIVIGPSQQLPMLVDSCSFAENLADFVGVGIIYNYNLNADFSFSNCLFFNNKAKNTGVIGCEAVLGAKPLKFINCAFISNRAKAGLLGGVGGALAGSNLYIKNCLFQKNSAGLGGAMSISYLRAENCLFIDNFSKTRGGAIRSYYSNYFTNCTFINNKADSLGGGIYAGGNGFLKDSIVNCIFIGNKNNGVKNWMSTNGAHQYVANTYIDTENCETARLGFAPSDSLTCGPNMFFNIDPMLRDTAHGDYRLAGCSPLLDQGDGAWVARFGLDKDYDGNERWQGDAPDIGAYETARFGASGNWQDALCYGAPDGEISLLPYGGFSPYSYTWADGTWGSFRAQLPAGAYQVTVSDADNCIKILQISIAQPDSLQITASITPNNNMQSPIGSITLGTVSGGTMPYGYEWDNGSIGPVLAGLAAAIYTVTITDSQGCSLSTSYDVPYVLATQQVQSIRVGVSPNPSSGMIRVFIPIEAAPLSLEIRDQLGKVRRTQSLFSIENLVSLAGLDQGVLTLIFRKGGVIVHAVKLVLH